MAAGRLGDGGDYRLWVADQRPAASVSEPASDLPWHAGTSGHVIVGGSATGELESGTDTGGYAVVLSPRKQYRIEVKGDCAADDGGDLANAALRLRTIAGAAPSSTQLQHISDIEATAFSDDDSGDCDNALIDVKVLEGGVYYVLAMHSDDAANGATGTYTVTVTDITSAEVLVFSPTVTLAEGVTATYEVSLATQPTAAVTVTVTGNDDSDAHDQTATLQHRAVGGEYAAVTGDDVIVTVADGDTRGVTVSASSLDIDEAGSGSYTIKLDTRPSADVTITTSASGSCDDQPHRLGRRLRLSRRRQRDCHRQRQPDAGRNGDTDDAQP